MNLTCRDREGIFLDGTPAEWAALEEHAAGCTVCAEEIRAWKALSAAAGELRDYREDLQLWAKIEGSLQKNQARRGTRQGFSEKLGFDGRLSLGWQTALAGALVVALAITGVFLYRERTVVDMAQGRLLRNSALAEVERTEHDYTKAIDRLAENAKPELDAPATPLMASYKEKLMVLDSAIDELRSEAGRNPSNAHLRYQLLAMYQEKQETLQEVLETKR